MRTARRAATLALVAIFAGGYAFHRVTTPYEGFGGETFVDLARGTSGFRMAGLLEEAGVVRTRWDFLLARALGRARTLQAGEYRFSSAASPLDVARRIARGDVFYIELVVPEGRNMFEIAASVESLGLFPAERFLSAARDPTLIRDLDPRAPSLEGYLYPDTYRLSRHTTPDRLCRLMTARFREAWKALAGGARVHDTVTLASLVEKETKLPGERAVIAAVFLNRLRLGMKLDCDPSTIYAAQMQKRYWGAIHKSDLASAHPYNTYQHAGLPPGPIANPGLASLRAVLAPAATGALYFVLRPDGSGRHAFSNHKADHEAAAARYRRARAR